MICRMLNDPTAENSIASRRIVDRSEIKAKVLHKHTRGDNWNRTRAILGTPISETELSEMKEHRQLKWIKY